MTREERGDRGLGWYYDGADAYGVCRVEVADSSSAEGPHCWLRLSEDERVHLGEKQGGNCAAHLDVARARAIRDALSEWLDRAEPRPEGGSGPMSYEDLAEAGDRLRVLTGAGDDVDANLDDSPLGDAVWSLAGVVARLLACVDPRVTVAEPSGKVVFSDAEDHREFCEARDAGSFRDKHPVLRARSLGG